MVKKILSKILHSVGLKKADSTVERKKLEEKVVRGAEKAVREYRRVFERLADYDRT